MTTKIYELSRTGQGLVEAKNADLQLGQIIFLNGYGQDEHSHDRIAVYEINEVDDRKRYKTVNLEKFTLRTVDAYEVKPISQKFGIGLYYIEGDYATKEEVLKAVPIAQAKADEKEQERKQRAEEVQSVQQQFKAWFTANKPEWAKAIIIAELEQDESDSMSDYHGSKTVNKLLLAWSATERNDFKEMRQAARNAQETAFLADLGKEIENRENYSGGGGYYLGKNRYHGWNISKVPLRWNLTSHYTTEQIRIPAVVVGADPVKPSNEALATLKINSEKNGVELYFPGKPSTTVLDDLKANGWRWSRFNSCWYAKDGATARRFAAKYVQDGVVSGDAELVQAQEDAVSDNFCQANNI